MNFSVVLQEMGELGLAKEYGLKSLAIYEKQETIPSIHLATAYNNMSQLYRSLKQYKKAKEYIFKSLKYFKKSNNTFYTAMAFYNLGLIEENLEEFKNAKKHIKYSIILFESISQEFDCERIKAKKPTDKNIKKYLDCRLELSTNHKVSYELPILSSIENAKTVLIRLEEGKGIPSNQAINDIIKSIDIKAKRLGEQHPELINQYNELAILYLKKGNLTKAKFTIEKAVYIAKEKLNKNHPFRFITFNNYFIILFNIYAKGTYNDKDFATLYMFKKMSFDILKRNIYNRSVYLNYQEKLTYVTSSRNEPFYTWLKLSYIYMKHLDKLQCQQSCLLVCFTKVGCRSKPNG